ncbi:MULTISPECIES: NADH:flavin oxidoreductase [Salimicrobium]|uniref:12-oxophytodienoate reductase n=3 Tax=Salimicrobium TaxID=351195 RepID=K2G927_9BACI|nr:MULTISPECIES: NADH:flavin oxidoreductase [Salimicrobium]AKG04917.1 12-oxophytodienoate reductase [Salimicrobium jeotgali]EKE31588.1 NADH:flavin oxidoreductase [Salimicrobium jeotgali]MBM7696409.1 2,4-dienoyl-CoA reductase-like NADH-dependent reductase (Old Yellow Enzyme family) [Salimicrobium jeotgali]SDX43353.1 2,4-dienoyl-CoA reductase [Salimicrobium album]SIS45690.1 2,4-dienoyl-CoA reductase [Salimicrobium salexigens]
MTNESTAKPLFKTFNSDKLNLPNRTVMAPMTRGFSPGNVPDENVAAYYRRRAENEVGLIITEGTGINHPSSVSGAGIPLFHGEEALSGWAEVVKEVHEAGGKIAPQLWHVGMTRSKGDVPNEEAEPVGPSGLNLDGEQVNEPMSIGEVEEIVQSYAEAAAEAKRLGFDAIEIHGAHGYLIDQFFWKQTNQRTDRYGGDFTDRMQFAVEIVEACRQEVGEDFPVIFRFSQWKMNDYKAKLVDTPDELDRFLKRLTEAGVDIFHCSTRRFWEPEFEGSDLNLAGWTKKLSGKPVISVGSVGLDGVFTDFSGAGKANLDGLVDKIDNEEFDLVAIGRSLLMDPEWVKKVQEGRTDDLLAFSKDALHKLY